MTFSLGTVRTVAVLDREVARGYWLTLVVKDDGAVPLTDTCHVSSLAVIYKYETQNQYIEIWNVPHTSGSKILTVHIIYL